MGRNSKNRAYLNQLELIQLNDFMRTICTSSSAEDGKRMAEYATPWNDEAVVKHMKKEIPHITVQHVQGLRGRVFGEIKRGKAGPGRPSPRLEAIEQTVQRLVDWVKRMDPEAKLDA